MINEFVLIRSWTSFKKIGGLWKDYQVIAKMKSAKIEIEDLGGDSIYGDVYWMYAMNRTANKIDIFVSGQAKPMIVSDSKQSCSIQPLQQITNSGSEATYMIIYRNFLVKLKSNIEIYDMDKKEELILTIEQPMSKAGFGLQHLLNSSRYVYTHKGKVYVVIDEDHKKYDKSLIQFDLNELIKNPGQKQLKIKEIGKGIDCFTVDLSSKNEAVWWVDKQQQLMCNRDLVLDISPKHEKNDFGSLQDEKKDISQSSNGLAVFDGRIVVAMRRRYCNFFALIDKKRKKVLDTISDSVQPEITSIQMIPSGKVVYVGALSLFTSITFIAVLKKKLMFISEGENVLERKRDNQNYCLILHGRSDSSLAAYVGGYPKLLRKITVSLTK